MMFKRIIPSGIAALLIFSSHAAAFDTAQMVAAHNKWRADAGVPPLSYSAPLAKSAQAWANHLMRKHACQLRHSNAKGRYGENLYWASPLLWSDGHREPRAVTPAEVVASWGSEKADYNHADNSCATGAECGHYTQLVWRDTSKVGCGMAACGDSLQQVWICHYAPPGNIAGEKPY